MYVYNPVFKGYTGAVSFGDGVAVSRGCCTEPDMGRVCRPVIDCIARFFVRKDLVFCMANALYMYIEQAV